MSINRFVVIRDKHVYRFAYVSELKLYLDNLPLKCYDYDIVMESLLLNHEYQLLDFEGNEQLHILLTTG